MQTQWTNALAAACLGLCLSVAQGPAIAEFQSGSDGSDGAIVVNTDLTLDLPADGIFNVTTLTVAAGATLRFNRNPANTPVYILATGDISIAGSIDIRGLDGGSSIPYAGSGGPGGFDGGLPTIGATPASAGQGPGGGQPGNADDGSVCAGCGNYNGGLSCSGSANHGASYGSTLVLPLVGGSGGGGTTDRIIGGGGGGGAILLASDTRVSISGGINAAGGSAAGGINENYYGGHGSGGAIRIVAPEVLGTGVLDVAGGTISGGYFAGQGRVRIDAINGANHALEVWPPESLSIGALLYSFHPGGRPSLAIIEAAGTVIPEGRQSAVEVLLPFDASAEQNVVVQARNLVGTVPIEVVLIPRQGDRTSFSAEIDMGGADVAQVIVPVTLPANVLTEISAWVR